METHKEHVAEIRVGKCAIYNCRDWTGLHAFESEWNGLLLLSTTNQRAFEEINMPYN